ncbi:hypothetical protein J6590_062120 [Homalodisca vitripennis]|nr:hypothetical protein J6590_062120 [Homalodisca vitripennis]
MHVASTKVDASGFHEAVFYGIGDLCASWPANCKQNKIHLSHCNPDTVLIVSEVDARGFHESVFDGIGDYFPSWPAPYKRDHNYPLTPSLAQRLGLQPINRFSYFHPFQNRDKNPEILSDQRRIVVEP